LDFCNEHWPLPLTRLIRRVSACSIDALGPSNFDGVWLEGEHGPLDYADIGNLGRACDLWGMTSLARVKKAMDQVDENTIYRTLDRGVQGIIVPHINTRAEAEMVVAASKFKNDEFPMGRRGMFLSRQGFGVPDYYMKANHETMTVILIEDIVAVNNLPDILKVDHIDVFHVAFADLAQCVDLCNHFHCIHHPHLPAGGFLRDSNWPV
jgi:2-keto-3-deoxy-L-rhamnonate aldolase RhmA